ncbi:MAG: hypothetical protein ACRDHG_04965 [Anaerolineales bacterium]
MVFSSFEDGKSAGSGDAASERKPVIAWDSIAEAWRALLFPLFIALLLIILQVLPGPRAFDDAYITYRYARNLAHGDGFVYNRGERVLGTTTPLYTILLALTSRATSSDNFPRLSIGINAIFDLGTALLLVRVLTSFGMPVRIARLVSIAYVLSPLRIWVALGGMETSMAVFWLLAGCYRYAVKKDNLSTAACSGIACLTRPDLAILPVLLAAHAIARSRRIPWKPAAAFAAVTAPWLVFSWFYFGSPLPQSIIAKSSAYFLHPYQASVYLLAYVGTRSWSSLRSWPVPAIGISAIVMLWLYVVGSWRAARENPRALPLALFSPLYVLALSLANPLLFIWYYPPLLLLLEGFVSLGIFRFVEAAKRRFQASAMGLAIAGLLVLEWAGTGGPQGWIATLPGREAVYATAAGALQSVLEPGRSIGLPEIGVFGYAFGGHRVVDTVGLVTPEAVPYLLRWPAPGQTFTYAISNEVIAELSPDYIITLEIFVRPTLMQSESFRASYRLIREFETDALGSHGLLVFERSRSD